MARMGYDRAKVQTAAGKVRGRGLQVFRRPGRVRHSTMPPVLTCAFVAFGAACVLAACGSSVDLAAVQEYAEATAEASGSFSTIAADFQGSCLRRRGVVLLLPSVIGTQQLVDPQMLLAPGYSPEGTPQAAQTQPPVQSGYVDDTYCAYAQQISSEWDRHNKVLLAYVQELGAIAAVDVAPTLAPAPLSSALVKTGVIKSAAADAFSKLGADISGFVIAGEQRELISRLVKTTNPSIQEAVDALKSVDSVYSRSLESEFNSTEIAYADLLGQESRSISSGSGPDRFLLGNQILEQRAAEIATLREINSRRTATLAYASVLDGIAKTHAQLFEAANHGAKLSDYVTIFRTTVVPLYQDVHTLAQAVK